MELLVAAGDQDSSWSLNAFDYVLPGDLIAQVPAATRDGARLLVLDRSQATLVDSGVRELTRWLAPGDVLVLNDTRVRAARLFARTPTGGRVELLLIAERGNAWHCLGRPARSLRPAARLTFPGGAEACVHARLGEGRYAIKFAEPAGVPALLARHGELPLPPYIHRSDGPLDHDLERYQTIFAAEEGAVAAPTAGLHFTSRMLDGLRSMGVEIVFLTLHVGPGTFLPVRHDDVRQHEMEPEQATVPVQTAAAIVRAKRTGRRVVAVGTTSVRALESAARRSATFEPGVFLADAFIRPGFEFQIVDALLTNFHLPRSTLLMLVSAFAGRERLLAAYRAAIQRRYRFYSYGDAMLIV